jgi:hypothetical protein
MKEEKIMIKEDFTDKEKTVLYQIDGLRGKLQFLTKGDVLGVVDEKVLEGLIQKLDVVFDASGLLVYAPVPRIAEILRSPDIQTGKQLDN